ncbi:MULTISPECIES: polymer-forming cytoskeletal protein [unclassified Fusibacter]|uniref:bactofilin family protein n=1 Tax=unclassified Fusibacter TaxID=2624464 RepID=UPI001012E934|nr:MULTISPECIES: polymer-forming cytoskeletal protein [unclassified Fusibacter]MCK8061001.1 polymer-forming cytoskeletal protein [Fusibacter sp. A2]NPE20545.1 polymer-forming cytoskeletal protein [Fusibacter sp. A1]RXV63743.1 polymer-forming cytoskeletal protein [Fusibacter sp. A1]
MFPRKDQTAKLFDIIVGKNSTIEGKITSEGSVRIDGQLTGDVISKGDVLIGPDAKTTGHIEAINVEISGEVEGNVTASGAFRIYETGMLFGDIKVSSFAIDEGGVFEGLCHINTQGVKSPARRKPVDNSLGLKNKDSEKQNDMDKNNKDAQNIKSVK